VQRKKLLLIVTDGEPADIDERDPQHLRHDTKKAVEELYSHGIMSYCLTLGPERGQLCEAHLRHEQLQPLSIMCSGCREATGAVREYHE